MGAKSVKNSLFPVHDLFFKAVVKSLPWFLWALMRMALTKAEFSWFDWSKAKFLKSMVLGHGDRELRADVVFQVPLTAAIRKQLPHGLRSRIKNFKFIFLVEHKAQNANSTCQQIAKMVMHLPEDGDSIIVPIVIYHGKGPWTAPRSLHGLRKKNNPIFQFNKFYRAFAKNVPNFEYRLIDLNKMSKKKLASFGLTSESFPYMLKMIWAVGNKDETEKVLGEFLKRAEKLPADQHRIFMKKAVSYVNNKYPGLITKEVIVKAATKVKAEKVTRESLSLYRSTAQRNFEYGQKKGLRAGLRKGQREALKKGRQEGRVEEQRAFVRRMLKARIDRDQIQEISGLSKAEVEKIRRQGASTKSKKA